MVKAWLGIGTNTAWSGLGKHCGLGENKCFAKFSRPFL